MFLDESMVSNTSFVIQHEDDLHKSTFEHQSHFHLFEYRFVHFFSAKKSDNEMSKDH